MVSAGFNLSAAEIGYDKAQLAVRFVDWLLALGGCGQVPKPSWEQWTSSLGPLAEEVGRGVVALLSSPPGTAADERDLEPFECLALAAHARWCGDQERRSAAGREPGRDGTTPDAKRPGAPRDLAGSS